MRFIHIADIHLGAVPDKGYAWSKAREEEIWKSFRAVLKRAEQEQIDLLLIAGDLFHRQPLMRELKEVNYLFGRLSHTQVVLIAGNHDHLRETSMYRNFEWGENVVFLNGRYCECARFPRLQTTVYGFSYYEKEITEPLYDDLIPDGAKGCHILLAHGGDDRHIPINKRKLMESGFDYIALGHIHKPQYLAEDKIAYAGALEPLECNDTGVHGYIHGEYTGGSVSTEFVPFAGREYIQADLRSDVGCTDSAMEERVEEFIREHGEQHIYRFTIRGFRDPDIVFHTERYLTCGNILEIADATEPEYDLEALCRVHGDDVVGRYIRKLWDPDTGDEKNEVRKQALYYGLNALLSSKRP